MKAVRFHAYGEPDVLCYEDVPEPEPGPGEVLLRVRAAGVNRVDIALRSGQMAGRLPVRLPHTPGLEFAGEVVALGDDPGAARVGQRVAPLYQLACRGCEQCLAGREEVCERGSIFGVHRPGGYAMYASAPAEALVVLPDGLSFPDAASCQTTLGTAWHALVTRARLTAGETVLVTGAGGGVGTAAVAVARHLGARVIAVVGSEWKADSAIAAGADVVLTATHELTAAVLESTDGRGVDVALESAGGESFRAALAALAFGGRIVVVGGHAGDLAEVDLAALRDRECSIVGSTRARPLELRAVIGLAGDGALRPFVSEVLPLADAARAHELIEGRRVVGNLVLSP
jgi:NADPH:quinone reductase-like Zn-dependent oxidoreductase